MRPARKITVEVPRDLLERVPTRVAWEQRKRSAPGYSLSLRGALTIVCAVFADKVRLSSRLAQLKADR